MSKKKAGGSTKNLSDSKPKFLGVKRGDGQTVKAGEILVRQRGTRIEPGQNVRVGKDHTLYAVEGGRVAFADKRKIRFNGKQVTKKTVSVEALAA